jgi:hypothetical protein
MEISYIPEGLHPILKWLHFHLQYMSFVIFFGPLLPVGSADPNAILEHYYSTFLFVILFSPNYAIVVGSMCMLSLPIISS